MRKKGLFLILFAVLFRLTISVSSSFAQDIDVSNMDNAQLMALLQAIMEKLGDQDAGSGTQDADQLSADSSQQAEKSGMQDADQLSADSSQQAEESGMQDSDQLSADSSQQAVEAGGRIFSIYENKKLILERLPDYMFYQPPTEVPEEPNNNGKQKDNGKQKVYPDPTPGKPCLEGHYPDGTVFYLYWGVCCDTCGLTCGCG